MGHTQWMPEVWLHLGIDYDGDGKISPYGPPDDALATTARFFVERGNYRRGERWGYEVRMPRPISGKASRSYAAWHALGVVRADGEPYPQPHATARAWVPVAGGPAFLLGPNFFAARSYNPAMSYALGLVYLGDRCTGRPPFVQQFPGSASRRRRLRRSKKSSTASPHSALIPAVPMAGSATPPRLPCKIISAKWVLSLPTAMPASVYWRACAKALRAALIHQPFSRRLVH
jgi:hypothetical protein